MMHFWKDGVSIRDLEKMITCFAFVLGVLAVIFNFIVFQYVDANMTVFVLGLGGLFVARKAFKYSLDKQIASLENNTTSTGTSVSEIVDEDSENVSSSTSSTSSTI